MTSSDKYDDFIRDQLAYTTNFDEIAIRKTIRIRAREHGLDPRKVVAKVLDTHDIKHVSQSKKGIKRALKTTDEEKFLTLVTPPSPELIVN